MNWTKDKLSYFMMIVLTLSSCKNGNSSSEKSEDLDAKQTLQGIWLDDDTETPVMKCMGDSVYYADEESVPAKFFVMDDSIHLVSFKESAFHVEKLTQYSFWFKSDEGEVLKYHKSENPDDGILFTMNRASEQFHEVSEVIKKDSIINVGGVRYRGYVTINPTSKQVAVQGYSEQGMDVERYYYDNIIHVCVYVGNAMKCGTDVKKEQLVSAIPQQMADQVILTDMDFTGYKNDLYCFRALLQIPESPASYYVNIGVTSDNKIMVEPAEQ